MRNKTIAIIEDDQHIGDMLAEGLHREHYEVLRAYSSTEALHMLEKHRPDLVLVDLMLPGLSDEELLPCLSGIPVIVISAEAATEDKVKLLIDGAVDYVTKPLDLRRLLARIAVHLQQKKNPLFTPVLTAGPLRLDTATHQLTLRETPVHLTRTEYTIIKLLMQRPGRVIARSVLLESIGQNTLDCSENRLKQHVSNLRIKLRKVDGHDYIDTVWRVGFRLVLEES